MKGNNKKNSILNLPKGCEINQDTLSTYTGNNVTVLTDQVSSSLVGLTEELHKRLHVQARNLLLEYRLSPNKSIPVDKVESLMRLYGNLIAELIWEKQNCPEPDRCPACGKDDFFTVIGLDSDVRGKRCISCGHLI